jgi:hypothetical protein
MFPHVNKMICVWHIITQNVKHNFRKFFEVESEYDELVWLFWHWHGSMSEEAIDYNAQLIKNHFMEKATKSDDNRSAGLLRQQKK